MQGMLSKDDYSQDKNCNFPHVFCDKQPTSQHLATIPELRSRTQPWNYISWLCVWHIKWVVLWPGATGATKGGSCPRKPQSQWYGGQKRKRFRAKEATSLPSWQIACTEHPCIFKHTTVREEQLEQPKEAAVPESPKANDTEDRRENVSEQKRSQV